MRVNEEHIRTKLAGREQRQEVGAEHQHMVDQKNIQAEYTVQPAGGYRKKKSQDRALTASVFALTYTIEL